MKMFTILLLGLLLFSCNENSMNPADEVKPNLLIGLSLQQYKNSASGLEGYMEGLDDAVQHGINIFGMSPQWNELEPRKQTYTLQDNLINPLTLLDPDKNKLYSYIMVLKMIDTNVKLVPEDLANVSFDDPEMIKRFSLLLEKIFNDVPSVERISHILIGNEIDGFLSNNPDQVAPFETFYAAAVQKIHTLSPDVKTGTIITFSAAKNNVLLFNTFKSTGDFICYTYYPTDEQNSIPWQMRPPGQIKDDIDWMIHHTDGLPIAFTETGYPSSTENASSETQQSEFVDILFNSLTPYIKDGLIEFVYYHGMYDYPPEYCLQYAQQQGIEATYLCGFMNSLGLHSWETGQAKAAWNTFVNKVKEIND